MEYLNWVWDYAVPFLLILTVLVFVHELGHYLVARRNGVRVEVFSIGFGPELFGWDDRSGTRWKFSVIPLGGYIRMFGEEDIGSGSGEDIAKMTPEEQAVSFQYKRVGQRAGIVFAGPFANFLFAVVILSVVFATVGQAFSSPEITEILPGSAAEAGGLREGDRIVRIDDDIIERFEDIQWIVSQSPNVPLEIWLLRGGEEVSLTIAPSLEEGEDRFGNPYKIGLLGIRGSAREYVRHGPATAVFRATEETFDITFLTLKFLGQLIAGRRSTDEIGGPLRIAKMSGDIWQFGLASFLRFMAVLSISLGIINLFPIPLLDGGHLLFFAAEALRGKPLGDRVREYGFRIGLVLVLSLMLFVTWNDLDQLGFFNFLKGFMS